MTFKTGDYVKHKRRPVQNGIIDHITQDGGSVMTKAGARWDFEDTTHASPFKVGDTAIYNIPGVGPGTKFGPITGFIIEGDGQVLAYRGDGARVAVNHLLVAPTPPPPPPTLKIGDMTTYVSLMDGETTPFGPITEIRGPDAWAGPYAMMPTDRLTIVPPTLKVGDMATYTLPSGTHLFGPIIRIDDKYGPGTVWHNQNGYESWLPLHQLTPVPPIPSPSLQEQLNKHSVEFEARKALVFAE